MILKEENEWKYEKFISMQFAAKLWKWDEL